MVVMFRACPRCAGDLNNRSDHYGEYQECLQCGHVQDIQRKLPVTFKIQKGKMKPGRKPKVA
ncbi:MAG: hypothetical protein QF368_14805 [SAR202 cluster bacterium]|nr:hypothetical protein [SAR202 cluster bacterium]